MRNFLLAAVAAAIALPAQPLANASFQVLTSPAGLTSLKRVHDAYDTDYIAGGRALGNVLVRYKLPAETSWQTALYPTGRSQSPQSVSYRIGKAIPTVATSSKTSASYRRMPLGALNDQIEPASSSDETVPSFLWIDRRGTREWVQYDFSKPESVSGSNTRRTSGHACRPSPGACSISRTAIGKKCVALASTAWRSINTTRSPSIP